MNGHEAALASFGTRVVSGLCVRIESLSQNFRENRLHGKPEKPAVACPRRALPLIPPAPSRLLAPPPLHDITDITPHGRRQDWPIQSVPSSPNCTGLINMYLYTSAPLVLSSFSFVCKSIA